MWRFALGWFFRTLGKKTRSQFIYAYNHTNSDPYNDLDGGATDWMYDYPAAPGHKGGFAINYEAMREGIDDLRYITTLENQILTARANKIDTTAAETVVANLMNSFDFFFTVFFSFSKKFRCNFHTIRFTIKCTLLSGFSSISLH